MHSHPFLPALARALVSCELLVLATGFDHSSYRPEETEGCLTCHPVAPPSHPLAHPAHLHEDWPLAPDGAICCLTCHDCSRGPCLLRDDPVALCRSCHHDSEEMGAVLGVAHIGRAEDLEARARDCLICHDGTLGKDIGGEECHPIDAPYPVGGEFEPLPDDERILLVNGRVTCLSCHDPYRVTHPRNTVDNHRSRLCLSCHKK